MPSDADSGAITAVRPGSVLVRNAGGEHEAAVPRGLLRGSRARRAPLAIGDRVRVERRAAGMAVVVEILPRRNKVSRLGSLRPPREQVIAANVDRLLAVQALDEPAFSPAILDRLLLLGEAGGVPGAVCLNKTDLGSVDRAVELLAPYARAGYPVFAVSARQGEGLAELASFLRERTTVMVGTSGVGKSSLINRLVPDAAQRTEAISRASGRGVHTTSRVDLFDMPGGGVLLDTPGMRVIHLWGVAPESLAGLFPELRPHLGRCRFRDCLHRGEPGCGIGAAVEAGEIAAARHAGYGRVLEDLLALKAPAGRGGPGG
ncbi:MAG: ribosome small subunit-dependent GTPase A [Candidatus Eisenbacteria bacterium]|uniref:Small ribosomal subunit biogenesis GTPase RsgA n=1 Tax=Eiseniibacteriota bacterium TaxID=2212470 RepID=A0A937X5J0_UNCEI|nr:ribosome small subunit-dependent GTPase A [Candidatus Eisenbacteria bacterium]